MIGVVLAGGASRRMGRDKAEVEVAGEPMLGHVVKALAQVPAVSTIVIAGRGEVPPWLTAPPDAPPIRAVADRHPDRRGPLAGLDAAFSAEPGEDALLLAVDMPYQRVATLRHLSEVEGGDAVVPVAAGRRQVTCALYRARLAPVVAFLVAAGEGSLQALLDRCEVVEIPPEVWQEQWGERGASFVSLDTPDAL